MKTKSKAVNQQPLDRQSDKKSLLAVGAYIKYLLSVTQRQINHVEVEGLALGKIIEIRKQTTAADNYGDVATTSNSGNNKSVVSNGSNSGDDGNGAQQQMVDTLDIDSMMCGIRKQFRENYEQQQQEEDEEDDDDEQNTVKAEAKQRSGDESSGD